MRDQLICEYAGVTRGPDCAAAASWNSRLASGSEKLIVFKSDQRQIGYSPPLCEMLVEGEEIPETDWNAYSFDKDGGSSWVNDQHLLDDYGVRFVKFTLTKDPQG